MRDGYIFHIDGPLSLFSAADQVRPPSRATATAALPRLPARSRAASGTEAQPRSFLLEPPTDWSPGRHRRTYTPAELSAFVEQLQQVAPGLGDKRVHRPHRTRTRGAWVPRLSRVVHQPTGNDVFLEVVGFWKRSSRRRLTRLSFPATGRRDSCWRFPIASRSTRKHSRSSPGRSSDSKRFPMRPNWQHSSIASSDRQRNRQATHSLIVADVVPADRKDVPPWATGAGDLVHGPPYAPSWPQPPSQRRPKTTGPDQAPQPVEVLRDRYGISHIYARNEHDLFLAQGFSAARDRLFQLAVWRSQATGNIAEDIGTQGCATRRRSPITQVPRRHYARAEPLSSARTRDHHRLRPRNQRLHRADGT